VDAAELPAALAKRDVSFEPDTSGATSRPEFFAFLRKVSYKAAYFTENQIRLVQQITELKSPLADLV